MDKRDHLEIFKRFPYFPAYQSTSTKKKKKKKVIMNYWFKLHQKSHYSWFCMASKYTLKIYAKTICIWFCEFVKVSWGWVQLLLKWKFRKLIFGGSLFLQNFLLLYSSYGNKTQPSIKLLRLCGKCELYNSTIFKYIASVFLHLCSIFICTYIYVLYRYTLKYYLALKLLDVCYWIFII